MTTHNDMIAGAHRAHMLNTMRSQNGASSRSINRGMWFCGLAQGLCIGAVAGALVTVLLAWLTGHL